MSEECQTQFGYEVMIEASMGLMEAFTVLFSSCVCACLLWIFTSFLQRVWWTPIRIQKMMSLQGIKGPPYKYPHGNTKEISQMRSQSMAKPMEISHDIFPRIQPHVYAWIQIYGKNFLSWHGSQAQLFVTESDLIKEILNNREGAYPKMDMEGYAKKLLGESLITNEGEKWAKVRKLANHTFHAESLKSMIPAMCASVDKMLERWKQHEGKEMDVYKEFGLLTTEVISRTAFGSSYLEGKHIFEMVAKLTAITVKNIYKIRLPGISQIMKTPDELEAEKLDRGIRNSILEIVKKKEEVKNGEVNKFATYLAQLANMAHEFDMSRRITLEQMVDEMRALYGAGHLTTTNLLTWTILLLAVHKDWQEKARKEVLELFGQMNPYSDGIARLRTMNMIINESMRLYPPVITMTRKVQREVRLGNLNLPKNINIFMSVLALHHNPQIWGKDVHLFKPERFAEGVAKATNNNAAAFLPFGMGPRTCVGLNFTTNEAKIALSMILQRFKFTLSPTYVHYPADIFILTPKNGVQIILQPV